MLNILKKEFTDPEKLKDAERGIALGLVVGTIFAALTTTSDYIALNFDYVRNQNPYGVLWYWLNPGFWADLPYRYYILTFSLLSEGAMWYFLVRKGKLSKFLFYAGWLQSIIWMRGSVFQNVTVTTFAPLISLSPLLIIPFILLQKLPLGWSLVPWQNQHWWCAFVGNSGFTNGDTIVVGNGLNLISCPGGWLRWNPAYSWFWSYAMIAFWLVIPTLWYLKTRGRGTWESIQPEEAGNFAVALSDKGNTTDMMDVILGKAELVSVSTWFCTFCSRLRDIEDMTMLDDRFYCELCMYRFQGRVVYETPEYPEGPCCEGGDMCDGSCLTE